MTARAADRIRLTGTILSPHPAATASNMPPKFTVISSGPSPYARKVRIALTEKAIPYTLQSETPWDNTTATPRYNPLEKLPVLIPDDDPSAAVYESHFIMEWLAAKHDATPPRILPPAARVDALLKARQIEVVADGVADAMILWIWESRRDEAKQSAEWSERQRRKVDGGLRALARWADEARGGFLVDGEFGLADIAVGSTLGFLTFSSPKYEWKATYPVLQKYHQMLEERQSFKETVPVTFHNGINDKVV